SETIIFPKLVYHLITPALGLEYQTKYIDFSAEYTLEYLMRSGLKPFQHPHYVTLGLKWKPSVKIPIQIMVGSDIGLNPADYFIQGWQPTFDYNIFGGVSVGWSSITSENRGMDTTAANKPSVEKNNAAQREAIPTSDVQEAIKPQDFKLEKDPLLLRFRKPDISKNLLLKFRN
ncbi:MAG: hypothetical protein HYS98_05310, partial [Deltaproteobacteria bacterium]|nr:hypothetical protein [Deltaproteobacteria bacterium]